MNELAEKKIDTMRRKLCLFSALVPVTCNTTAKVVGLNHRSVENESFNGDQYKRFYTAWVSEFKQAPKEYITAKNAQHSPMKSSEIVQLDFSCGNVIAIDNFILSKYEPAVIAHIGSYA